MRRDQMEHILRAEMHKGHRICAFHSSLFLCPRYPDLYLAKSRRTPGKIQMVIHRLFGMTYRVARKVHAWKEGKTGLSAVIQWSKGETCLPRTASKG